MGKLLVMKSVKYTDLLLPELVCIEVLADKLQLINYNYNVVYGHLLPNSRGFL